MRLSAKEIATIKSAILQFDPSAKVFLYGSRVLDHKKGGDIDLLVLSSVLSYIDKGKINYEIFKELEEQRIDITIAKDDSDRPCRISLWATSSEV